jgi:putative endonuclease
MAYNAEMGSKTAKQEIGALGEDIATKYLQNKGFTVIERNYLKKCGEIDIIAKIGHVLHFVEVKSVSHEIIPSSEAYVTRRTDSYRPEDNIHPAKLKRLSRTIELYLFEKHTEREPEWQFDAITVKLDMSTMKASVKFIENIIL